MNVLQSDESCNLPCYSKGAKLRAKAVPILSDAPSDYKFPSWSSIKTEEGYNDPSRPSLHQPDSIMDVADVGDVDLIRKALRERDKDSPDINQLDDLGRNALHLATALGPGSVEAVEELLRAGINPNVKDNVGMTPLSLCVLRNPCLKIIQLLFEYGAKLLPRSSPADPGLFLHFVMLSKPTQEEKEILRILVEQGALVNDPNCPGQRQALHIAAMSNNCEMIITLVEMGADITARNHRNQTPKEVAASYRCKEAQFCLEELEYRSVFQRTSLNAVNGGAVSTSIDLLPSTYHRSQQHQAK